MSIVNRDVLFFFKIFLWIGVDFHFIFTYVCSFGQSHGCWSNQSWINVNILKPEPIYAIITCFCFFSKLVLSWVLHSVISGGCSSRGLLRVSIFFFILYITFAFLQHSFFSYIFLQKSFLSTASDCWFCQARNFFRYFGMSS